MFYDEEQKTVFLQLNSVYDFSYIVKACRGVHQNLSMAVSSMYNYTFNSTQLIKGIHESQNYYFLFFYSKNLKKLNHRNNIAKISPQRCICLILFITKLFSTNFF